MMDIILEDFKNITDLVGQLRLLVTLDSSRDTVLESADEILKSCEALKDKLVANQKSEQEQSSLPSLIEQIKSFTADFNAINAKGNSIIETLQHKASLIDESVYEDTDHLTDAIVDDNTKPTSIVESLKKPAEAKKKQKKDKNLTDIQNAPQSSKRTSSREISSPVSQKSTSKSSSENEEKSVTTPKKTLPQSSKSPMPNAKQMMLLHQRFTDDEDETKEYYVTEVKHAPDFDQICCHCVSYRTIEKYLKEEKEVPVPANYRSTMIFDCNYVKNRINATATAGDNSEKKRKRGK